MLAIMKLFQHGKERLALWLSNWKAQPAPAGTSGRKCWLCCCRGPSLPLGLEQVGCLRSQSLRTSSYILPPAGCQMTSLQPPQVCHAVPFVIVGKHHLTMSLACSSEGGTQYRMYKHQIST